MSEIDIWRAIQEIQEEISRLKTPDVLLRDDGTYTPTYLGGATAGTTTYSIQQGAWIRLGNLIIDTGTIVWTATTGTGDAHVSLSHTVANVSNQNFSGSLRVSAVTFAAGTPQIAFVPNTQYFIMQTAATNANATTVAMEAAGNIIFTCVYFTA